MKFLCQGNIYIKKPDECKSLIVVSDAYKSKSISLNLNCLYLFWSREYRLD